MGIKPNELIIVFTLITVFSVYKSMQIQPSSTKLFIEMFCIIWNIMSLYSGFLSLIFFLSYQGSPGLLPERSSEKCKKEKKVQPRFWALEQSWGHSCCLLLCKWLAKCKVRSVDNQQNWCLVFISKAQKRGLWWYLLLWSSSVESRFVPWNTCQSTVTTSTKIYLSCGEKSETHSVFF